MIACKHCNTQNSLDSTFCKRCGTGLPEDDLAIARLELEKIVAEGFSALASNWIEEAYAIAESATTADPSSVQALVLKCACHERRGEVAEALECAERIVELNPNSELDKIRRNQLRSALASVARTRPHSGRWVAAMGGVSVGVLILCCGVVFARNNSKQQDQNRVALNQALPNVANLGSSPSDAAPETQPQTSLQNDPAQQQPAQTRPAAPGSTEEDEQTSPVQRPARKQAAPESTGSATLPSIQPEDVEVKPVEPTSPPVSISAPAPAKVTKSEATDPQPQPETQAPPVDHGQVDIRLHAGSRRINFGGSEPVVTGNSVRAYTRVADNEFQNGNYSAAASNLEQALKTGGDAAVLNQRLGQSYEHLGRISDAVTAFQRAVDAATAEIQSGQGDSTHLQRIKSLCESYLALHRGGQ